jgi:uncharacterized protein YecE (DUF72 family)
LALTFADSAGKFGYAEDVTSDFIYIRLHGKNKLYESDYSDDELAKWSGRIRKWSKGNEPGNAKKIVKVKPKKVERDVFVYFDNSIKVHAPFDAMQLATRLGIRSTRIVGVGRA